MSRASDQGRTAPEYQTVRNGLETAYRAVKNRTSGIAFTAPFTIKKGSPVSFLPGPTNESGCDVIPCFGGGGVAAVLANDLAYGPNGNQSSNAIRKGLVQANVLVITAAAAVKGASLVPMFSVDGDGYGYFVVTTYGNSPFRLMEDLTGEDDLATLKVDVDGGALIEIADGIEHFLWWGAAAATDDDYYYTGTDAAADTSVTLLNEFPDIPRNGRTVSDGATTAAFNSTWTGYNVAGEAISETISVSTTNGTVTAGSKVFARVTNIAIALPDASTAWKAGFADVWQLPRTASGKAIIVGAKVDDTLEGTAPTLVMDPDEICKNTIDFNTAADGTKVFSARILN